MRRLVTQTCVGPGIQPASRRDAIEARRCIHSRTHKWAIRFCTEVNEYMWIHTICHLYAVGGDVRPHQRNRFSVYANMQIQLTCVAFNAFYCHFWLHILNTCKQCTKNYLIAGIINYKQFIITFFVLFSNPFRKLMHIETFQLKKYTLFLIAHITISHMHGKIKQLPHRCRQISKYTWKYICPNLRRYHHTI